MARFLLATLALAVFAVAIASAICGGTTSRSTRFSYPITVEIPPGVSAGSVGYYCTFDREMAEFVAGDASSLGPSFEAVPGPMFEAAVRGHRNTSWCGLVENVGRQSFIVVRLQSLAGQVYVGLSELPPVAGPVVVPLAGAA